jgi:hypothetical protein
MRTAVLLLLSATSLLGACVSDDPLVADGDLSLQVGMTEASGDCVDAWHAGPLIVHAPAGGSITVDEPAEMNSAELAVEGQHGTLHMSYRDLWTAVVDEGDESVVDIAIDLDADLAADGTITGDGDGSFLWRTGSCDFVLGVTGTFDPQ